MPPSRIPLCLVTGFLGSGKTTLLSQLVSQNRARRFVYLVNEFSPQDVDGEALLREGAEVVAIPGGSIFCKCLVVGFLQHLRSIPDRFRAPEGPVEGVIIEASGVADPRVAQEMLQETGLDAVYRLARIISVVEPGSLRKLLAVLPAIRAQIEASDLVLINKADLHDEAALQSTEAAIRAIRPAAAIIRAVRCQLEIDPFAPAGQRDLHGQYARCADPDYFRLSLAFPHPVDAQQLARAIAPLRDDIYRLKGAVPTPAGMAWIDLAGGNLNLEARPDADFPPGLAVIVRPEAAQSAAEALARFGNVTGDS